MRPKTIALIVASAVTIAFLAAVVAVVEPWRMLASPDVQGNPVGMPRAPQVAMHPGLNNFQFNVGVLGVLVSPIPIAQETPCTPENLAQVRGRALPSEPRVVTGPFTYGNLAIFLLHGPDAKEGLDVLTLQEALEQNVAVVHETRSNQLMVDNQSKMPLFIQAGDIVKGGTQDRVLPYDLLVPPLTNNIPLAALCVEQGRSFPRGNETSTSFQTSTEHLPGAGLRLAAYRQSQMDVWSNVKNLQVNLGRNVGAPVQSPLSQTSLQLTLENPRVQDAVQNYMLRLAPAPEGQRDVVGFAVALNGKIQTADLYASNALFQKLWPKQIRASAVEAVASDDHRPIDPVSTQAIAAFLAAAEQGPAFRRDIGSRTVLIRQDSTHSVLHDTCDPSQQNVVFHRSFLSK